VKCFKLLVGLLAIELDRSLLLLNETIKKGQSLNVNFDIFEFTLMRYICQLNSMFFEADEEILTTPSAIIQNRVCRDVWEKLVGADIHATDESFLTKVWLELAPAADISEIRVTKEFLFFEYCLNFPRDNIITAYKWHCLCSQFGPFDKLMSNLVKLSNIAGFVGVVNSIQAAEMLSNEPTGTTMIRFSRLQPDFVTFTIKLNENENEIASFRFQYVDTVTKEQLGVSKWRFLDKTLALSALSKAYYRNIQNEEDD